MHIFIGEVEGYTLFNNLGMCVIILSSLILYKLDGNVLSLLSKNIVYTTMKRNTQYQQRAMAICGVVEMILLVGFNILATTYNVPFGRLVGTEGNYFATLFLTPVLWFVFCCVVGANPVKKMDIATLFVPVFLFFVKIACYCAGCCHGIPWEYGPYNHKHTNPGNQVPVQLIEALWGLAIFLFFLWYRKHGKKGTMFPMYMILYSATRFCSEFFRTEENVYGFLKTYHILCLTGIAVGGFLLYIAIRFGDKISDFFDRRHEKVDVKIAKCIEAAHEKARTEKKAEDAERLEKVKAAREKAKARRGKK